MDFMPNDLRLVAAQDIVSSENKSIKENIMKDPEVGKLLLAKM
jgi:hypothetical protein